MTNLRSHTDFRSSVVPKKLHNYETWRYWEKGDKKWNGISTYIYASLYGATWKLKFRMILLSCLLISRLHTQRADILWPFRLGFSKDCWKILMIVMCLITSCLAHNPPERSFFLINRYFLNWPGELTMKSSFTSSSWKIPFHFPPPWGSQWSFQWLVCLPPEPKEAWPSLQAK